MPAFSIRKDNPRGGFRKPTLFEKRRFSALPPFEASLDSIFNRRELEAGGESLGAVQYAIGAWRFRGQSEEFRFISEEFEVLVREPSVLHPLNDFPGGDRSGIGEIVGPERELFSKQSMQAAANSGR